MYHTTVLLWWYAPYRNGLLMLNADGAQLKLLDIATEFAVRLCYLILLCSLQVCDLRALCWTQTRYVTMVNFWRIKHLLWNSMYMSMFYSWIFCFIFSWSDENMCTTIWMPRWNALIHFICWWRCWTDTHFFHYPIAHRRYLIQCRFPTATTLGITREICGFRNTNNWVSCLWNVE